MLLTRLKKVWRSFHITQLKSKEESEKYVFHIPDESAQEHVKNHLIQSQIVKQAWGDLFKKWLLCYNITDTLPRLSQHPNLWSFGQICNRQLCRACWQGHNYSRFQRNASLCEKGVEIRKDKERKKREKEQSGPGCFKGCELMWRLVRILWTLAERPVCASCGLASVDCHHVKWYQHYLISLSVVEYY